MTGLVGESVNAAVRDSCSTGFHILGLLDQYIQHWEVERSGPADRAALWVIYAASLIHLHANDITAMQGRGLLELDNTPVADSYIGYGYFQSVASAYSQVKEAIHHFKEKGGRLNNGGLRIIFYPEDAQHAGKTIGNKRAY